MNSKGICSELIQFFEQALTGTRSQFVGVLVAREIATADDANFWVDQFLRAGEEMGLIPSADFGVLMETVVSVGRQRAVDNARAIYEQLLKREI